MDDHQKNLLQAVIYCKYIDAANESTKLWNALRIRGDRHEAQGHSRCTLPNPGARYDHEAQGESRRTQPYPGALYDVFETHARDFLQLGLRTPGYEYFERDMPLYIWCPRCNQATRVTTLVPETS